MPIDINSQRKCSKLIINDFFAFLCNKKDVKYRDKSEKRMKKTEQIAKIEETYQPKLNIQSH